MGQVALTAGYYLMSRLHMDEMEPLPTKDLFDVEHVDVKDGLVGPVRVPQNHLFLWKDPARRRDTVVLLGEAQPPAGKIAFCSRLLDYAERRGVREVYTFAAMATEMHPRDPSRVFGVATDAAGLQELRRQEVQLMTDGRIGGLNGVFLGAAADRGLRAIGLLGEMPAFALQVPYPKASRAVLGVYARMTGIEVDLQELDEYAQSMEGQLTELLQKMQDAIRQQVQEEESEGSADPAPEPPRGLSHEERRRIEELFSQALRDRSRTFELKRELDRLGAFREYEDRFLDLYRKAG
jgi:hypothetical protein